MTYRKPVVGIVGAGQLARMTVQAAISLDVGIVLLAASATDGAAQVCPDVIVGSPDERTELAALAAKCDVMTFDHELVDPVLLRELEDAGHTVWPSSASLALAQNKRRQRAELGELGLPIPAYAEIGSTDDANAFGGAHGWPIVLKASRGGYDGRGVWVCVASAEADVVVQDAHANGIDLLAEELLPLEQEFAVLLARRPGGELAIYPPIETVQAEGICRELRVPANVPNALAEQALAHAAVIAEHVGIVGILAIEFFVARGQVYVNELAPRPHNSGHWTIEGAHTSQFEQHLRAILDWPLGSCEPTGTGVVTANVIGTGDSPDPRALLPGALNGGGVHVHLYGKAPRAARKVGHVTAVAASVEEAGNRANAMVSALLSQEGDL